MKVDVYSSNESSQGKGFCKVLIKSGSKSPMLNNCKYLKTIDLKPMSIYIGLDSEEAIANIEKDGFYMSYCQI